MPQIVCPTCASPLRFPTGRRKLICPACQAKFRLPAPPPPPAKPWVPPAWRFELVSAAIGVATLAALFAVQVYLLLPYGRAHPGERVVRLPGMVVDGEMVAGGAQSRPYNEALFWGSVVGYLGVAATEWYVLGRWKSARARAAGRHGRGTYPASWRRWRGGTAALIVLVGGLAVAMLYRDVLWAM